MDQSYQWKTDPDGSDGNIHGEGDDDSYGYNYAAALSEANERGNAALYVVKVSADANKMSDLAKEANAVTGKEYDGTSSPQPRKSERIPSPTPCLNGLIRSISPMWQTAPISRNM